MRNFVILEMRLEIWVKLQNIIFRVKKSLLFLIFVSVTIHGFSKTDGQGVFSFLDLTYNARSSALGSASIAIRDNDLGLVSDNPALLNSSMKNQLTMSLVDYFAGITYGQLMYAGSVGKIGRAHV